MKKNNDLAIDFISALHIIKEKNNRMLSFNPQSPLAQLQLNEKQKEIEKQKLAIKELMERFVDTFLNDEQKLIKFVKDNEALLNKGYGSLVVARCNEILDK